MKTIVIIATICKETGALSIYNQMITHLAKERCVGDLYYIFIDPIMPNPVLDGVKYIIYNTSGIKRIKFDLYDCLRICETKGIIPDVIFSLNNSGVRCPGVRQILYYHQGLPLYRYHFSLWDKKDWSMSIFAQLYPHYVKRSLTRNTTVIVQTDIVRMLFAERYHFSLDHIHVAFPDIEQIDTEHIDGYVYKHDTYNYIYPSTALSYKEHITIVRALKKITDSELLNKIRIHLTIRENERKDLQEEIIASGLLRNFVFHGPISHNKLMSMYKSADGLLFPSVLETVGLPLLESAAFGLPVLANDLEYVKDVLTGYDGLMTVPLRDYSAWGKTIEKICIERPHYNSYHRSCGSEWPNVFKLIHGEQDK